MLLSSPWTPFLISPSQMCPKHHAATALGTRLFSYPPHTSHVRGCFFNTTCRHFIFVTRIIALEPSVQQFFSLESILLCLALYSFHFSFTHFAFTPLHLTMHLITESMHLLFLSLSQCSWCSLPAQLTSVELQCPGCAQRVRGFAGIV